MPRARRGGMSGGAGGGGQRSGVVGSAEQEQIWHDIEHTDQHIIVDSVAGSGKTFTAIEGAKRLSSDLSIAFVAFNKHIAEELKVKLAGVRNVQPMTYHSLGFRAVRQFVDHDVKPDSYTIHDLLDNEYSETGRRIRESIPKEVLNDKGQLAGLKSQVAKLTGLAKGQLIGFRMVDPGGLTEGLEEDEAHAVGFNDQMNRLMDEHGIDANGLSETIINVTHQVLHAGLKVGNKISFDDMIWLPWALEMPMQRYDVMFVDELQDTNLAQQWLAVNSADRIIGIGDSHQAIYAFRGADSLSMRRVHTALSGTGRGVKSDKLTVTRRCPQSHVRLAQVIVPHIRAMDDAPEGEVHYVSEERFANDVEENDLVLCRVNAPLVGTAYRLLKRKKRVVVRGRDIGQGLTSLLKKAEELAKSGRMEDVMEAATVITREAIAKYMAIPNGRGEMRAATAQDRLDCLTEISTECQSVSEMKRAIQILFEKKDGDGKPVNVVVLGTVHRTKGLEANRVWILQPNLIPHPMAKNKTESEQERNLAYVAVTRAMYTRGKDGEVDSPGALFFVDTQSELFAGEELCFHGRPVRQVCADCEEHEQRDRGV